MANSQSLEESTLQEVVIDQEVFYKITNVDHMRPFFMTIVSDSNHWMFVSSNGGISAGRKNSEYALFPYYTDDIITASAENTGSKTIFRTQQQGKQYVWEPFSVRSEALYHCQRNLYKNRYGNKIIFEEINHDLSLTFRYEWNSSNLFGFVRKASLLYHGSAETSIEVLDGLQNIMPYGVTSDLQRAASNLADAYKRSELLPETGVGIFALSAIIVDKAEPSEALKANTVWSAGLNAPRYLLSSLQLESFRKGGNIVQEEDVKGEKGAYFINAVITFREAGQKSWFIVANVNQSQSDVIRLQHTLQQPASILQDVLDDVEAGTKNLVALVAAADGIQYSADQRGNTRHFSNTLFNIMRGGIFDDNYNISKKDFLSYLKNANQTVYNQHTDTLQALPDTFTVFHIKALAAKASDSDFIRLATEYLPLKFSRRHGDPSRPWNKFSINTRSEIDGSKILDYEGNWRDIFQNWEALAHAYPAFIEGMMYKFLNASTFDGYNPYRVTKGGFDWETIEPDNPWSYIGYWGDHQLIYLLKFLEFAHKHYPGLLQGMLSYENFVYAHVPYIIKPYTDIKLNPKDTIEFDHVADTAIRQKVQQIGADGALLTNAYNHIHRVNFTEKLLATLLAKITNLVPDGGIWMNTQRPEWNDANNALVGNGLSMVTLYYLRRFLVFIKPLFDAQANTEMMLSEEMKTYFSAVLAILEKYKAQLPPTLSNAQKMSMLDELGSASSDYRSCIYANRFSGKKAAVHASEISSFIDTTLLFVEQSIDSNKRSDGLYHTYNLLSYNQQEISVAYLDEMLEGQVAVLSSRYLNASNSLQLLNALRQSALYRKDQNSYILYPNKELPRFLQKNNISAAAIESSPLLQALLQNGGMGIIDKDIMGGYHFNGRLRNANDLKTALQNLDESYQPLVKEHLTAVLNIHEQVFNHKAFTGRSGTFFGYEGLGSIYWHMVSKLLLAVQEVCDAASKTETAHHDLTLLYQHFHAIKEGIGVHKSPALYGAFPTDPYSHTPMGKGAQQPGMTGQVKEDLLSRFGELGVYVNNGRIGFYPSLLKQSEFSDTAKQVKYVSLSGKEETILLEQHALLFTYCQVPIMYVLAEHTGMVVTKADGTHYESDTYELSEQDSLAIFHRTGNVQMIKVFVTASSLCQ